MFGQPPFSEEMLAMTVAQLDWCIQMYAQKHPGSYKLARDGRALEQGPRAWIEARMAWDKVLHGEALSEHRRDDKMAAVDAARRRFYEGRGMEFGAVGGMRAGVRRGALAPSEG